MPSTINPVKRILSLLKLEQQEIYAVYFYAILNGLIQLSVPIGVQAIVGFVAGASMRASLIVLIALVVLGVLTSGIMQINQMKLIEKIQQKIFVRYSFAFARHIPRLDLKTIDTIYLPEVTNRFFDIPVLQKSLSKILLDIPTATIQILFGLLLLSFYHPAFIFFGVILIILLVLILKYTGNQGLQSSLDESTHKYKVASWLQEMARIIKTIKFTGANDMYLQKTDDRVTNYLDSRNQHFRILLIQYHVLIVFKTIITAAMLIVGTILLVNQQLNIGQFVAAEIVILLVLNSVEKIIINLGAVYDTLTAVEKLANLTDIAVEKNGTASMDESVGAVQLEMKNVSFGYDPTKEVLHNISMQINAGEKVRITGKDSSGKSTLLRLMGAVYTDYSGAIMINEMPLGNYNMDELRSAVGVLLNEHDIFQGTLWENIIVGNTKITRATVLEYAHKTGLTDFVATLSNGYDAMLDPNGKRLPRNVIHKILLVRALAAKPPMLLLEDPLLYIQNYEHRQQIMQLLNEIKNTTVIIITNDESFSINWNKVITVNEGAISIKNLN